ncbi:MAG: phenylacetate--CoA ligase family protein [Staphylococcus equorum]|nr:phenylacetate--CoA ligase family protein [Staphylococcus equorum]
MIGASLRRTIFWTIDALSNGNTRKHYYNIKEIMEGDSLNGSQLNLLLEHAKNFVPFYKNLKFSRFEELPILTKNDYKKDYDALQSEYYLNKPLHQMSTSGSTGTPFTVNQNMDKRKRTVAELIYFNEIAGQKLGDRYLYIKTWPMKKSTIESIKQNVIPIDILHLNEETLEKIRVTLKRDKSVKSILAYASTYKVLVDYLSDSGDTSEMFNIKAIFSSSALLDKETKEKLNQVFDCPIIDRYSNQENGVLAQTKSTLGEFYINRASYHIELLKLDSDKPAEAGELGRIVLTDLYNFAMPMLRYDTGDLAISDDEDRDSLKTLRSIQGRRVDIIYDTKGNVLTPHTWSVNMRKYSNLKQWQFIQEDKKRYVLKVNGGKGVYSKEDFDNTLRSILGSDAEIEIQYVDEIPVLSSGKFKNTICNYKPFNK